MEEQSVEMATKALSSPAAQTLVERISNGIARLYDPIYARKMNKVENRNRIENAKTDLEVARIMAEERRVSEQINIDQIAQSAASMLSDHAKPGEIDQDWINKVRDKMKSIEDGEMQNLWAKIIAGEADRPGTFSYRVLEEVALLSKAEAHAFTELAGHVWCLRYAGGEVEPILVVDSSNRLLSPGGVLIQTALIDHFSLGVSMFSNHKGEILDLYYYGSRCQLKLLTGNATTLSGKNDRFVLSAIGKALFGICGGEPILGNFDTMVERWSQRREFDVVFAAAAKDATSA